MPSQELAIEADLEDAAEGGAEGLTRLRRRLARRTILRSELLDAKRRAEENGQRGEEFVHRHLQENQLNGHILTYSWSSNENAIAPYDFVVSWPEGDRHLDVKSTSGEFDRPIHVSLSELEEMASRSAYDIYRVFDMQGMGATLRVARDMKGFAQNVLRALSGIPSGVVVDSISIRPATLPFGPAISLTLDQEA